MGMLNTATQLPVTALREECEPIANPPVSFVSRAPARVSVWSTGVVSAAEVGSAWVVATTGTLKDGVRVAGLLAGPRFKAAVSAAGTGCST